MTRLVVDAGVLSAATVVAPDTAAALLIEAVKRGTVEMVVCEQLIDELRRSLNSRSIRHLLDSEEREELFDILVSLGSKAGDPVTPPRIVSDPKSDYLVALANASNADAIITSARELLDHGDLFPPAIDPRTASSTFDLMWSRPSLSPKGWMGSDASARALSENAVQEPLEENRDRPEINLREESNQSLAPQYRRLPHGPSGMGAEELAQNHRARLYGAMIESVSQRGYSGTTVAHLIALAGVSRRAFYGQFSSKEQCFLATHDIVVAGARKEMVEACDDERGQLNRLRASCKALLDYARGSAKATRLVLIDSLGIGPKGRERMQLAGFTFERLVATVLAVPSAEADFPKLTSRAVVGGVRNVMFVRVLKGHECETGALTNEVLDWIESYRTPAAGRLSTGGLGRPADVPPAPAAFLARDDRRARLLGSVVHLTLDSGYEALTDPQIAQFAGISTQAFHQEFANKEECFLAVLDEFTREALDSVLPCLQGAESWPEAVHRAMGAFVDYLVAHRALVRVAFIDVFEVGPGMIWSLTKTVEEFVKLLTESGPPPLRGSTIAQEAVTGAVWGIISSYVTNDLVARLPAMVDQLAFTVLAPYVGASQAVQAVES